MGADHVCVDVDLLEATAQRLGHVAQELTASRATADSDAQVIRHRYLTAALSEFSDNWRIRRENLITAVEGAHKLVGLAAKSYREQEAAMAKSLDPQECGPSDPQTEKGR